MIGEEMESSAGSAVEVAAGKRRVLIDALNVAYWCGLPPSLRIPLTAMCALLADGHEALLCFDASARYRLAAEAAIYARLIQDPRIAIEVPSGRTADAVLLKRAKSGDACILSRDKYRDHRRRHRRFIDDPGRLMTGWVSDDRLLIPSLGIDTPLSSTADDALVLLQAIATDKAVT